MKTAIFFLLMGVLALVALGSMGEYWLTPTGVDVHLHDTYFIVDRTSAIVLASLSLLTLFALGGLLGNRFRSAFFWILFLLALLCWGSLAYYVLRT